MELFGIIAIYLEFTTFLLTILILLLAIIQDVQNRLVDGIYWIILFFLAIPINLIRLIFYWNNFSLLVLMSFSVIIGITFAILIAYFGLWGEADILALICISMILPASIFQINNPIIQNVDEISLLIPLSITLIMNASILQLPLPLIIFMKNIKGYRLNKSKYFQINEPTYKKFFACFLGEPLLIRNILDKPIWYYQVMEKNPIKQGNYKLNTIFPVPFVRLKSEKLVQWTTYRNESKVLLQPNLLLNKNMFNINNEKNDWKFDFSIGLKSEEEDLYKQRTVLKNAFNDGKKTSIWVQFSVPFLLPLTLGLVLSFFQINILFEIYKMII